TPSQPPTTQSPSQPPSQPTKGKTRFVVSSFNVLGSSHTVGGKGGYASGVARIRQVADLIRAKGVDVVGFQEFASDQAREFKRVAGGEFGTFPGPSKRHLGSHNTIAWRKDTWKLVESYTVDMPSHKGRMQPSPVVRLKNKHTGQEVYFTNFHNASGFHINQQQHWRDQATTQQVALINKLKRSGLPVIVTGDMNEKANYHRRLTNEAGMDAANELKNGSLPRALYVDWIFGSQDVTFKGYHRERKSVLQKISDHGMLVSKVVVGKQKG
ncbi:MAG: endonuclease/exonuclease/phosphatase family protein, partial [Candidatus Sericytochromatia bacterium]